MHYYKSQGQDTFLQFSNYGIRQKANSTTHRKCDKSPFLNIKLLFYAAFRSISQSCPNEIKPTLDFWIEKH